MQLRLVLAFSPGPSHDLGGDSLSISASNNLAGPVENQAGQLISGLVHSRGPGKKGVNE
jgi:hypothetical protein